MKKSKLAAAFFLTLAVGMSGVSAFGAAPAAFQIPSNQVTVGTRNAAVEDIVINEAKAGLFKKGSYIYLRAENIGFEEGAAAEVVSGDLKIDSIKADGNILKIKIGRESTKTPGSIKISGLQLYLDGSLAQGNYSLELITKEGGEFKNNCFGGSYGDGPGQFDTESITLLENFVSLVGKENDNGLYDKEANIPRISVRLESDELNKNQEVIQMEGAAYLQDGHVMLPVRAVAEALSDSADVRWNGEANQITITLGARIAVMKIGEKQMSLNGSAIPMEAEPQIKDDRAYMPLRDLAMALGISEVHWDDGTKTATLN